MKFLLGKKIKMSQIFRENGEAVPVTLVEAGPCFVTQVKLDSDSGHSRIQIGFDHTEARHLNKPQLGHLKDLPSLKFLREFSLPLGEEAKVERGDEISLETFKQGERVEVVGVSKGKGFQGVVKRHHFSGGPATHGHKDNLRMPGDIGAGGVQRVFKDQRMAGRMGGNQVTVKNLEIAAVEAEKNILQIKGALPGGRNALVAIIGEGDLVIKPKTERKDAGVGPLAEAPLTSQTEKIEPIAEATKMPA